MSLNHSQIKHQPRLLKAGDLPLLSKHARWSGPLVTAYFIGLFAWGMLLAIAGIDHERVMAVCFGTGVAVVAAFAIVMITRHAARRM